MIGFCGADQVCRLRQSSGATPLRMARKSSRAKSSVNTRGLVLRVGGRSTSVTSGPVKRSARASRREKPDSRDRSCSPELPAFRHTSPSHENSERFSPEIPLQVRRTSSFRNECYRVQPVRSCLKSCLRQDGMDVKRVIPDYFPVRKSHRLFDFMEQLKAKEENESHVISAILSGQEVGFEVRQIPEKGRAVFTTKVFKKDEFVLEYAGKLRSLKEARQCEKLYSENQSLGCFMFYFKYLCKSYCIDATEETKRLGRLINHSRLRNNLVPKIITINGYPHLILVANRRIEIGEELLYDYGDRSKASLRAHPWLAT